MDLEEYLNLPSEDVTKEVFEFIIAFSVNESKCAEFEQLWETNELPELETVKSKSAWEVINNRIDNNVSVADDMNLKPAKSPFSLTYRVA